MMAPTQTRSSGCFWPHHLPSAEALQVHQKGMTFDAFFAELAEGGSIKHEALCKRLDLGF